MVVLVEVVEDVLESSHAHRGVVVLVEVLVTSPPVVVLVEVLVELLVELVVDVLAGAQPSTATDHSRPAADQVHLQRPEHAETAAVVVVVLVVSVHGSRSASTIHLASAFRWAVSSGPAGTSSSGLPFHQSITTAVPSWYRWGW